MDSSLASLSLNYQDIEQYICIYDAALYLLHRIQYGSSQAIN